VVRRGRHGDLACLPFGGGGGGATAAAASWRGNCPQSLADDVSPEDEICRVEPKTCTARSLVTRSTAAATV